MTSVLLLLYLCSVDGRGMMGDLFIAFARIGRTQVVEAFEFVRMEEVSNGTDGALYEVQVAFVRR